MVRYEYKILMRKKFFNIVQHGCDEESEWLNKLGDDGWELYDHQGYNGSEDKYSFKRIK